MNYKFCKECGSFLEANLNVGALPITTKQNATVILHVQVGEKKVTTVLYGHYRHIFFILMNWYTYIL